MFFKTITGQNINLDSKPSDATVKNMIQGRKVSHLFSKDISFPEIDGNQQKLMTGESQFLISIMGNEYREEKKINKF